MSKKYSILVVDDEKDLCDLVREQLESDEIECHSVYSGEESVEKLNTRSYDIVISDFRMPGMNGLELLKTINATIYPPPVLYIMTGFYDKEMEIRIINEGKAQKVFQKPNDISALLETVREKIKSINE